MSIFENSDFGFGVCAEINGTANELSISMPPLSSISFLDINPDVLNKP